MTYVKTAVAVSTLGIFVALLLSTATTLAFGAG